MPGSGRSPGPPSRRDRRPRRSAGPDEVARPDARRAQVRVDPEAGEVALEATRGLVDVEVGLGGDPLDPPAADPEGAVRIAVHDEAVADGVEAVDDDAGGLRGC